MEVLEIYIPPCNKKAVNTGEREGGDIFEGENSCKGSMKEQEMLVNVVIDVLPLQGSPQISRLEVKA
jgi:hypothetical protein